MAFTYNCLTFAGAGLLAQADSSNPIVYIGAVGSTDDYIDSQLQTMDSPSDARWDIQGGTIVAASATAVTARIIAGFTNRASSTTMKSIGIVGRLASQPDSQAIVVASVSDPSASIRIPSTAEPDVRIEVALNITITDTASVTVTSSTAGSAMLSDLDRLVSCHKPGQPTTGEAQYIYGAKHFENLIYAWGLDLPMIEIDTDDGNITWTDADDTSITYVDNATYDESLRISADTAVIVSAGKLEITGDFDMSGGGKVVSDLIPDGVKLGASGAEWSEIHGEDGYFDTVQARVYSGGTFSGGVEVDGALIVGGTAYLNEGYDLDNAAPLTVSKCPLVCGQNTVSIGGIMLAIVTSTTTGTYSSGQLIPSTVNIYKASARSVAGGQPLAPTFEADAQLTNDGSSYLAISGFRISGTGHQALALIIRVK